MSEDSETICRECDKTFRVEDGCDPTDYCHGCVYTVLEAVEEELATAYRERDAARAHNDETCAMWATEQKQLTAEWDQWRERCRQQTAALDALMAVTAGLKASQRTCSCAGHMAAALNTPMDFPSLKSVAETQLTELREVARDALASVPTWPERMRAILAKLTP